MSSKPEVTQSTQTAQSAQSPQSTGTNIRQRTFKLAYMGILAALSLVFVIYTTIPIFPAAPHLKFEISDTPIMIAGFMYGPVAGILITAVVCLIQALTVGADGGIVGFAMHFIASGTLVAVSSLLYKKYHNRKGAIIALITGTLCMTLISIPSNIAMCLISKWPLEMYLNLMLPVYIPFNLIKAGGNSLLVLLVYKQISKLMKGGKALQ